MIKLASGGKLRDNAILTYCYLDPHLGVSYRVICCGYVDKEGNMEMPTDERKRTGLTLLEGSLVGEAVVLKEDGKMLEFKDEVEEIKRCFGVYPKNVIIDDRELFSIFRHPANNKDFLAYFFDERHKRENMWVREIENSENGWVSAKLLHEPLSRYMGVHKDDVIQVMPLDPGDGEIVPAVILPWMKNKKPGEEELHALLGNLIRAEEQTC
jgi:hypothetical protein